MGRRAFAPVRSVTPLAPRIAHARTHLRRAPAAQHQKDGDSGAGVRAKPCTAKQPSPALRGNLAAGKGVQRVKT